MELFAEKADPLLSERDFPACQPLNRRNTLPAFGLERKPQLLPRSRDHWWQMGPGLSPWGTPADTGTCVQYTLGSHRKPSIALTEEWGPRGTWLDRLLPPGPPHGALDAQGGVEGERGHQRGQGRWSHPPHWGRCLSHLSKRLGGAVPEPRRSRAGLGARRPHSGSGRVRQAALEGEGAPFQQEASCWLGTR